MKFLLIIFLLSMAQIIHADTVKVEIKRTNGSMYWTAHFKNKSQADKWLASEKNKRYWKGSYTTTFTTIVTLSPTPAEISKKTVLIQKRLALKGLSKADLNTTGKLADAFIKLLEVRRIK